MARQPRPCSLDGCDEPVRCRELCTVHYSRWRTTGDVKIDVPPRPKATRRPRVGNLVLCVGCKEMLPTEAFAQRRSRCRPCNVIHDHRLSQARRSACSDCGSPCTRGAKRCHPCASLAKKMGPAPDRKYVNHEGYVFLKGYHDHPNANRAGNILEHQKVMSDTLGRPLGPGENVHHKNGVKGDNRPENLELWVVSQPPGQRPADLVEWAHEILARYESEVAA